MSVSSAPSATSDRADIFLKLKNRPPWDAGFFVYSERNVIANLRQRGKQSMNTNRMDGCVGLRTASQ